MTMTESGVPSLVRSCDASFDAVCALMVLQGGASPQLADHRKRSRSPPVRPAVSAVLGDAGQKPAQRSSPPTTLKPIKSTGASQVHRGAIPRPPSSVKASASKLFQAKPSPLSSQQHHPYQRPPLPQRPPMPPPPLRWSLQPPVPPPQRTPVPTPAPIPRAPIRWTPLPQQQPTSSSGWHPSDQQPQWHPSEHALAQTPFFPGEIPGTP